MARKHRKRVAELLACLPLIVKASRDYQDTPWLRYDQHYRCYTAAKSPKQWGATQPELWTLYFGRAVTRPHCATCSEVGHGKCDGAESPAACPQPPTAGSKWLAGANVNSPALRKVKYSRQQAAHIIKFSGAAVARDMTEWIFQGCRGPHRRSISSLLMAGLLQE